MTLASTILALNPIAYWKLDETSGTAAVNYGSLGTAANGTYTGVTLASATAPGGGSAPYFDGANDYLNIYSTTLNGGFSGVAGAISLWVKVYNAGIWTDGLIHNIIILLADSNNYVQIYKSNSANALYYFYKAGGTSEDQTYTGLGGNTDWIHLAITWTDAGDQVIYYANGVQVGTTDTGIGTWAGNLSSTRCIVGANLLTPTLVWNGYISHVSIHTSVLTAEQIAAIYAAGTATAQQYTLTADYGRFALTGQAATFKRGYALSAARGAFTLTGKDVTLKYPTAGALGCVTADDTCLYTVTANDTGLYTVTANDTCLYTVTASDMRCT